MQVDLQNFKEKGYLILRQVIPPEMLQGLRHSCEELVCREWPDSPSPGRPSPITGSMKTASNQ